MFRRSRAKDGTTRESGTTNDVQTESIFLSNLPESSKAASSTEVPDGKPSALDNTVEVDVDLESENDPEIKPLLPEVRRIVSLHDDPSLPTLTFRYFVLSTIFVIPGAFLSQMNYFRTTYAPYSVFFVQICSHYFGQWMARALPHWTFSIPFFPKLSVNINPGPWSVKEHVLVTITAASGAISNLGVTPLAMAEVYFGQEINAGVAIFFMFAIVGMGYGFTAIGRQVLLYDPDYPWFQALCQTALFETQRKQISQPTKLAKKQMHVFWTVLVGISLWQFLPEYIFPMLGSVAFLCYFAPENPVANFIGSGLGGMGFMNLSFDWANISNYNAGVPLFLSPWYCQVVLFTSFVMCCWVLLPAAQYGNLGSFPYGLMTNRALTANGTKYPVTELVTAQNTFNDTAYAEFGPVYVGTQQLWSIFFDYASYTSAYAWIGFFGFSNIRKAFKKFRSRNSKPGQGINHQYQDRLNVLMRAYPEVPLWWYLILCGSCFVIMMTILGTGYLFIPIWTYFVAIGTGALTIIPLGWLYAISNFQLPIGTFNELLYGTMLQGLKDGSHRNPAGPSVYGAIAGDCWYRAQYMLQDQKIGHYMHVPQRKVFFSQIWGLLLGIPTNYAAMRWVLSTKKDYLSGAVEDPSHIWTGQSLASSLTTGVQYALIGPSRLFQQAEYSPLPYAFLVGAACPVIVYTLHRLFPRARFDLWNTTIFFSGASTFYGNVSTGYFSRFLGGFVVMFWAYRYRYELWSRYNFILAAAFDAGFNLNMLLVFLIFGSAKVISAPNWWGNNADNVERCFALPDDS